MEWIQYVLFAVVVWLLVKRFMPAKGLKNLSAQDVQEKLGQPKQYAFIDVREVHEYKNGHIKGFRNIPLSQLTSQIANIPKEKSIVLTCRSGMRSRQAAKMLRKQGFDDISHLQTGIAGWQGPLAK
ncbi:rhodanese-like domain-containing protein [Aneurinibacillus sp. REN35]|uniref:rhodanese-like domain-containing protein n=1 Tax=Aneurinibacillus sp. REN35 TaxID=3237286 RepID=UPI003527C232